MLYSPAVILVFVHTHSQSRPSGDVCFVLRQIIRLGILSQVLLVCMDYLFDCLSEFCLLVMLVCTTVYATIPAERYFLSGDFFLNFAKILGF